MYRAAAVFFGLFLVTACGMDPELAPDLAEQGQLDQGLSSQLQRRSVIYSIAPDYRKCPSPACGGWWVTALNQRGTTCADGSQQASCYVADIEWGELGLSPADSAKVQVIASEGRVRLAGWQRLEIFPSAGKLGVFHPRKAWTAATDAAPQGASFQLENLNFLCITEPCFNIRAHVVNSPRYNDLSDVDFSRVGASKSQVAQALDAMDKGDLLADGYVDSGIRAVSTRIDRRPPGRGLTVSQFYLPVRKAEDACEDAICLAVILECPPGTHPDYSYPNCCGVCVPDQVCYSDNDCGAGEICSVSLGDCQSPPGCGPNTACPAVCTGVCQLPPTK